MFRKNKYQAKKVKVFGQTFDSKGEANCFFFLQALEAAGQITDLSHHSGTIFLSDARVQYRPDFRFKEAKFAGIWTWSYAEYKGFETPMWRLKRRLWMAYGPGPLYIYKGTKLHETLIPTK